MAQINSDMAVVNFFKKFKTPKIVELQCLIGREVRSVTEISVVDMTRMFSLYDPVTSKAVIKKIDESFFATKSERDVVRLIVNLQDEMSMELLDELTRP